jgi:hypothetical protein
MFRLKIVDGTKAQKNTADFRSIDDALSEADHWRQDPDLTVIEDTDTGVQRSVAEWRQGRCAHGLTIPELTETGEQTGKHRCKLCLKIL